ncbi:MAG: MmgE/PrpD family protein, partial [Actinophytocola sp.]|nr:MmgE/PrpD family protein [Actinophytocola sp.]
MAVTVPVADHYARGWHATSTIGVLGATVAVARLCGATGEQLLRAWGIATSTA